MLRKYAREDVEKIIESIGYKIIKLDEYKNLRTKFTVECDKGHVYDVTLGNINSGKRCKICGYKRSSDKMKLSYDYVKNYIESQGYELISNEYVKGNELLEMKCAEGHKCFISWDNFKYGRRCRTCKYIDNANRCKHDFGYVKSYIESFGIKLLENEYVNQNTYMKMMCSEGHVFERHLSSFNVTQRCPVCGMSKGEERVKKFLEDNCMDYIYDKPYFDDLLSPRENPLRPDFILPKYKIWIEYDGEFHYDELYENDGHEDIIIHDKIKNEYAKLNGWKLIRIPYWEFDNIENILDNKINK